MALCKSRFCLETVLTVVDLGSSSKGGGLAVNNVRVRMADLRNGDLVRFGGCRNLVMGCVSNETESQHPTHDLQVFTFRVVDLSDGIDRVGANTEQAANRETGDTNMNLLLSGLISLKGVVDDNYTPEVRSLALL
jgi:hypothetical protein